MSTRARRSTSHSLQVGRRLAKNRNRQPWGTTSYQVLPCSSGSEQNLSDSMQFWARPTPRRRRRTPKLRLVGRQIGLRDQDYHTAGLTARLISATEPSYQSLIFQTLRPEYRTCQHKAHPPPGALHANQARPGDPPALQRSGRPSARSQTGERPRYRLDCQ